MKGGLLFLVLVLAGVIYLGYVTTMPGTLQILSLDSSVEILPSKIGKGGSVDIAPEETINKYLEQWSLMLNT